MIISAPMGLKIEKESPWSTPGIFIMSINLAKRRDMLQKLSNVKWDILVFDKSHLLLNGVHLQQV